MEAILAAFLAFFASVTHVEMGVAYTFSAAEGAPSNPAAYAACLRRDLRDDQDHVVAHRTLPCKSKVLIYNLDNGRSTVAVVGDRGPYGKTRGRYRGVLDMAPRVNRALKAKGYANVVLLGMK